MIEINLLPGTGKKKSGRSSGGGGSAKKINIGALLAGITQRIRDPWLISAVGSVALAIAVVGTAYVYQEQRVSSLSAAEQAELADSTRYAAALKERQRADARRDTLLRRMNLIRAIDEDRYIWPHVLDEVSKALPPYTWLSSLGFMGTPQGSVNVAAGAKPETADDKKPKKAKKVDVEIPRDEVRIRMIGLTPDIQALTRFMRQLEASPFFGDVQLNNSQLAQDQGKDVTQFTLDVTYTRPDTSVIKRVPVSASDK
ncbi:MAG TPA: PilN domain-containing protein [Gemmatimonadaceae bacterium]|nr:PilN domain-containing protein [Gemmatimonadaceae bacterium]